ncbi:MAG: D-alanine--D-alanine ligase [Clostridia bacterium]|nr:D-alanine--D-alanine ligase [Clostridia bacterium]
MKIVVLCGGLSMERNVSITSGTLICKALRALGHQAVLVDMFFGLEDIDTPIGQIFDKLPEVVDAHVGSEAPDLEEVKKQRKWVSRSKIGKGVLELCQMADVVFLGLHGACGEDGRIQATLDLLGVPYTGSGCLGSAIAMDKDLTKQIVAPLGVLTPAWKTLTYTEADIPAIIAETKIPAVVKLVDSGSSIGVSIAHSVEELESALRANVGVERVIIEQYVKGREIDVGVLDGKALPSIEIIPKQGFYDYVNKYQAGATVEICPTPIDPAIEKKLGEAALTVHNALGLKGYSRSDYIVDEKGDVYFLEINTLPGMTPTSLMPQEAAAAGIDYNTLCQMIVDLALRENKA